MNALKWRVPTDLLGDATSRIAVGDLVRTSDNYHPHYQIIAVTEDRARIRDTQHGTDHVVPVDRCKKI